jgi:hypothetical protein
MAASGILLTAWLIFQKVIQKFGRAKFVCNKHNGVLVLTKRKDFLKVKNDPQQKKPDGFVMVPNSLVFFGQYTHTWADKSLMLGDSCLLWGILGDWKVDTETSLFVPFVSSRLIPLNAQKKFFHPFTLREAEEYLHGDKSSCWEKLVKWYRNLSWPGNITAVLSCVLVASLLVWGSIYLNESTSEKRWEATTNTSTTDPTAIVISESFPIALENGFMNKLLVRVTITKAPIYMGGGLISAEAVFADGRKCAFRAALPNLKVGDKVIIRQGRVLGLDAFGNPFYNSETWAISESEAQALVMSGGFHFIL